MSEIDAQSFASWLDLTLVRNPTREKALTIECRTLDNVHSISVAPGLVGDIETQARKSERQTNRIVDDLLRRPGAGPVIVFCMKVDDTYNLCEEWHRGKNESVKLLTSPSLELADNLSNALTRRAAFHNAELSEGERLFVEAQISAGKVDVVYPLKPEQRLLRQPALPSGGVVGGRSGTAMKRRAWDGPGSAEQHAMLRIAMPHRVRDTCSSCYNPHTSN